MYPSHSCLPVCGLPLGLTNLLNVCPSSLKLYFLRPLHTSRIFFHVINLHVNNVFQTADWAWVFSYKSANITLWQTGKASRLTFACCRTVIKDNGQSNLSATGERKFLTLNVACAIFVLRWILGSGAPKIPHYWKLRNIKLKKCSDTTDNNLGDPASTDSLWCNASWYM